MDNFEGKGPKFSPLMYKAVLMSIMVAAFVVPLAWVTSPYIEFFNGMAVQPTAKAQMTYGWGLEDQDHAEQFHNYRQRQKNQSRLPRSYINPPCQTAGQTHHPINPGGHQQDATHSNPCTTAVFIHPATNDQAGIF